MEVLLNKKVEQFIPNVYKKEGLLEICRVANIILEQYFKDLNIADLQRNPKTATYSLQEWANMVGCNIDGLSNENAQKEILMSMKTQTQVTKEAVKRLVETNANAECTIEEQFNKYIITVTFTSKIGIPPNIEQIKKKLREVLPAHLNYTMVFKYRTWGDLGNMNKTWGYFTNKGYTWEDMRTRTEL